MATLRDLPRKPKNLGIPNMISPAATRHNSNQQQQNSSSWLERERRWRSAISKICILRSLHSSRARRMDSSRNAKSGNPRAVEIPSPAKAPRATWRQPWRDSQSPQVIRVNGEFQSSSLPEVYTEYYYGVPA